MKKVLSFVFLLGLASLLPSLTKAEDTCPSNTFPAAGTCRTCDTTLSLVMNSLSSLMTDSTFGCEIDRDCAIINSSTRCYGSCPISVLSKNRQTINNAVKALDENTCEHYRTFCPYLSPTCTQVTAVCDTSTKRCKSKDAKTAAAVEVNALGAANLGVGVNRDTINFSNSGGGVHVVSNPIAFPNLANVDYVLNNVPLPNHNNPAAGLIEAGVGSINDFNPSNILLNSQLNTPLNLPQVAPGAPGSGINGNGSVSGLNNNLNLDNIINNSGSREGGIRNNPHANNLNANIIPQNLPSPPSLTPPSVPIETVLFPSPSGGPTAPTLFSLSTPPNTPQPLHHSKSVNTMNNIFGPPTPEVASVTLPSLPGMEPTVVPIIAPPERQTTKTMKTPSGASVADHLYSIGVSDPTAVMEEFISAIPLPQVSSPPIPQIEQVPVPSMPEPLFEIPNLNDGVFSLNSNAMLPPIADPNEARNIANAVGSGNLIFGVTTPGGDIVPLPGPGVNGNNNPTTTATRANGIVVNAS